MSRFIVSLFALVLVAGCVTETQYAVVLSLYPDGKMSASNMTLAKEDLPAFAKEVGDRPVRIAPVQVNSDRVSFSQAAEAAKALKAAGVKNVMINVGGD